MSLKKIPSAREGENTVKHHIHFRGVTQKKLNRKNKKAPFGTWRVKPTFFCQILRDDTKKAVDSEG